MAAHIYSPKADPTSSTGSYKRPEQMTSEIKGSTVSTHNFDRIPVFSPVSIFVQPKLQINTPGDSYEQEADRIAQQVVNMPESDSIQQNDGNNIQRKPLAHQISSIIPSNAQRKCAKCEEEEEKIQRKAKCPSPNVAKASLVSQIQLTKGGGQPMEDRTNNFMSSRFGVDFSKVRIHSDDRAANMSQGINARAFTIRNDIYFNKGEYNPGTTTGKRLLAHELVHTVQQGTNATIQREVNSVEINCADNLIRFYRDEGTENYELDSCNVTEGNYLATVHIQGNNVEFNMNDAPEEAHFEFSYSISPGQPNPSSFFEDQRSVRIICSNQSGSILPFTIELPVTYEGTFLGFSPSSVPVALGTSVRLPSYGDMSWLTAGGEMRWATALGRDLRPNWGLSPGDARYLDRVIILGRNGNYANIMDRLEPRIADQLRGSEELTWIRRGFTEQELRSIPDLIRRYNSGGTTSLGPEELLILRRAAELHIGGSSAGSPLASYSLPDTIAPFLEGTLPEGQLRYRVRVSVDSGSVLDVSLPSTFTDPAPGDLGNFDPTRLLNAEEFEVLVAAGERPEIIHIERVGATPSSSTEWMVRNQGALRWGGRALFVVGAVMTEERIRTATPEERPRVVAEEAGGWGGGFLGAELGVAGCIAFGIVTEGAGLLLCGLAGGFGGGVAGSTILGHAHDSSNTTRPRQPLYLCFAEGTPVLTLQGLQSIETIKEGDEVLSWNEENKVVASRKVSRALHSEASTCAIILSNNQVIKATKEHPFFVKDKGFVPVKNLEPGDLLQTAAGKSIALKSISPPSILKEFVYNITVEEDRNYFVGKDGVLVHNK